MTSIKVLLLALIAFTPHFCPAFDLQELANQDEDIESRWENFRNSAYEASYTIVNLSFYKKDNPDIVLLSQQGDSVTFEYRGADATVVIIDGEREYTDQVAEVIVDESGTELLRVTTITLVSMAFDRGNYLIEHFTENGDMMKQFVVRNGERLYRRYASNGEIYSEKKGYSVPRLAVNAPYIPSLHVTNIKNAYEWAVDGSKNPKVLESEGKIWLEVSNEKRESIKRAEFTPDGFLMMRDVEFRSNGELMQAFRYRGKTEFNGFQLPTMVVRELYNPDGTQKSERIISSINYISALSEEVDAKIASKL